MPKKKVTKHITIKEISDAFYAGVSPVKLKKMAQMLVKQNRIPTKECSKNKCFDR